MNATQNLANGSFRARDAERRRQEFAVLRNNLLKALDWRTQMKRFARFYGTDKGVIRLDNIRKGLSAPSDKELKFFRKIIENHQTHAEDGD